MTDGTSRRRSSADSEAVRDAMCTRIRELGTDILAITQGALQKVAQLDDTYRAEMQQKAQLELAKQQQQQQQQQQKLWLSPRPSVNTKATRIKKAPPHVGGGGGGSGAGRSQPRPAVQTRPVLGGKSSAVVPASGLTSPNTHSAEFTTVNGAGRTEAGGHARGQTSAGTGKKKRKTAAASSAAAVVSNTTAEKVEEDNSQSKAPHSVLSTRAPSTYLTPLPATEPVVTVSSTNNQNPDTEVVAPAGEEQMSEALKEVEDKDEDGSFDFRRAAESSFQRILQHRRSRQDFHDELMPNAPLYDLSNAAAAASASTHHKQGTDLFGGSLGTATGEKMEPSKASDAATTSAVAARGQGSSSLSRSILSSVELPADLDAEEDALRAAAHTEEAEQQQQPHHQHALSLAAPASSYYRVVYIHQSTRARKQSGSASGSGYSSSRSGGIRHRPTSHFSSPGRLSPATADRDVDDEEPRMVNSYVSAVYAVEKGCQSHQRHFGDLLDKTAEEKGATATTTAEAGAGENAVTSQAGYLGGVAKWLYGDFSDPVVRLEPRMHSAMIASHTSTPSTGAFQFPAPPPGNKETHAAQNNVHDQAMAHTRQSQQKRSGRPPLSPLEGDVDTDRSSGEEEEKPTLQLSVDVAREGCATEENDEVVEAQIESMEGWRRDRRTSVEDRIRRRRRRSSFVTPGWQGEFYYYTSPSRVAAAPAPPPPPCALISDVQAAAVATTVDGRGEGGRDETRVDPTHIGSALPRSVNISGEQLSYLDATSSSHPNTSNSALGNINNNNSNANASCSVGDASSLFHTPPRRPASSPSPKHPSPVLTRTPPASMARAASPTGAGTTYDVLLQTRLSTSVSTSPRTPPDTTNNNNDGDGNADVPPGAASTEKRKAKRGSGPEGQVKHSSLGGDGASPAAQKSRAAGHDSPAAISHTQSPLRHASSPPRRANSTSTTTHASRRRHGPRLEVVVASDYNAMEWAFAGAARRASNTTTEAELDERSDQQHQQPTPAGAPVEEVGAASSEQIGGGEDRMQADDGTALSMPVWAAQQQQRETWEEEEQRRWEAQTRQQHGTAIRSPIVLTLALTLSEHE